MESRGSLGRYAVRVAIRRVVYVLIAAIIGTLIAGGIGMMQPANAATQGPTPGQTRTPSPGTGYRWGVPAAWLTRTDCGADSTAFLAWVQTQKQDKSGGWITGNGALIDIGAGTSGNNAGSIRTPSFSMLHEPEVVDCAGAGANRGKWVIYRDYGAMNDPRSGTAVGRTNVSYSNTDNPWICQATEWALPAAQYKFNGSAGSDSAPSVNSRTIGVAGGYGPPVTNTPTPANNKCPYLVSVNLRISTYTGPDSVDINGDPNPGVNVISSQLWSAEQWYNASTYYAPVDPEAQVCTVGGVAVSDQCPFVLGTAGGIDGTNPDQVCGNAPTPIWLDLGWLNKWIFYMAQCLFRPANGFDRGQWIITNWEAGPFGEISTAFQNAGAAFVIGEECGMILNTGGSGPLPGFTIDTCGWTQFSFLKVIIASAATLMFAWWLFFFIVSCIIGVLNRHAVNPLEEGEGSK